MSLSRTAQIMQLLATWLSKDPSGVVVEYIAPVTDRFVVNDQTDNLDLTHLNKHYRRDFSSLKCDEVRIRYIISRGFVRSFHHLITNGIFSRDTLVSFSRHFVYREEEFYNSYYTQWEKRIILCPSSSGYEAQAQVNLVYLASALRQLGILEYLLQSSECHKLITTPIKFGLIKYPTIRYEDNALCNSINRNTLPIFKILVRTLVANQIPLPYDLLKNILKKKIVDYVDGGEYMCECDLTPAERHEFLITLANALCSEAESIERPSSQLLHEKLQALYGYSYLTDSEKRTIKCCFFGNEDWFYTSIHGSYDTPKLSITKR